MANPQSNRKFARIALITAIIIVLMIPITVVSWRVKMQGRVDAEMQKVRDQGLPTSYEEMNDWVAIAPDEENGALVLKEAIDSLVELKDSKGKKIVPQDQDASVFLAEENREAVDEYLKTNATPLSKLEEGLKFSKFTFVDDYTPGLGVLLPHLAGIRNASQLLRVKTAVDARAGRESAVVTNLLMTLRLAHALDEDPLLISWLIRVRLGQTAARSLREALSETKLSDENCRVLAEGFNKLIATNLLPRAIAAERAMWLPIYKMGPAMADVLQSEEDSEAGRRNSVAGMKFFSMLGLFDRDQVFYLQTMEKAIEGLKSQPPGNLAMTNYFDEVDATIKKRFYFISGISLPALGKTPIRDAAFRAAVTFAMTALSIERFRNQKSRLPEKLEELAPEFLEAIPADPFDGKAIRYRKEEKGYLLYSVEADGRDDGGLESPAKKGLAAGKTYDLVYRVGR